MVTAVLLPLEVEEEAAVADIAAVVVEEAVSSAVAEVEVDTEAVVANLAPRYPVRAANRFLSK